MLKVRETPRLAIVQSTLIISLSLEMLSRHYRSIKLWRTLTLDVRVRTRTRTQPLPDSTEDNSA